MKTSVSIWHSLMQGRQTVSLILLLSSAVHVAYAKTLAIPEGTYTAQKDLGASFGQVGDGDIIDAGKAMFVQDSRGNREAAHNFNPQISNVNNVTLKHLRTRGSMDWLSDRTAAYRKPNGNGTSLALLNTVNLVVKEALMGTNKSQCTWDFFKPRADGSNNNLRIVDCTCLFAFDDVWDNPSVSQITAEGCWFLSMMGPAIESRGSNPQTLRNCTIELFQVKNTNKTPSPHIQHAAGFKHQGGAPLILEDVWLVVWDDIHRAWGGSWGAVGRVGQFAGDCKVLDLSHLSKYGDGKWDRPDPHGFTVVRGEEAVKLYKQRKLEHMNRLAHLNKVWPDFLSILANATGGTPIPIEETSVRSPTKVSPRVHASSQADLDIMFSAGTMAVRPLIVVNPAGKNGIERLYDIRGRLIPPVR